jgi:ketosteroid isomerase-like protein
LRYGGIEHGLSFWFIGQLLNNLPGDINTDYRHIAKPWPLAAMRDGTLKVYNTQHKMIKIIVAFIALIGLLSCASKSDSNTPTAPVNLDSLASAFNAGWNNKDSGAISKAIADDAILMTDSLVYRGLPEISKNWISGGVRVVSNLKTSPIIQDSDLEIAYSAGTYKHDLTLPGAGVFKINGNYNFAWKKQTDGAWRLTFIHLEDLSRRR